MDQQKTCHLQTCRKKSSYRVILTVVLKYVHHFLDIPLQDGASLTPFPFRAELDLGSHF